MMTGMAGGFIYATLTFVLLLLGFAYLVFVAANKESGWIKTSGQVIAVIIAIIALWIFLYAGVYGGMFGQRCGNFGGRGMMMDGYGREGATNMMDKDMMQKNVEHMMQVPGMREQVQEYLKTHK